MPTTFPIQRYWPERDYPPQLAEIPWALIAPHEAQAWKNHGQTLQRLAERCGTCPMETVAIIEGKGFIERWRWNESSGEQLAKKTEAINRLRELVENFKTA